VSHSIDPATYGAQYPARFDPAFQAMNGVSGDIAATEAGITAAEVARMNDAATAAGEGALSLAAGEVTIEERRVAALRSWYPSGLDNDGLGRDS
jgi:hypothetical protein